jgi:prepilin peptidase CpaA
MQQALEAAFVLASFAAAWNDARTRRIPNALTFALIAFGVLAHFLTGGAAASSASLFLALTTIVGGTFVYERGWLAGGDIKLLAGGAAVFGMPATLHFFLFSAIAGGALAVIAAARQRRLFVALRTITTSIMVPGVPLRTDPNYGSLPYGLAICAGALLTMVSYDTGLRLPL